MTTFVVDASVAIKWVVREPGTDEAMSLLKIFEARHVKLVAPRQIAEEVASALSKAFRQKRISKREAEHAFQEFEAHAPKLNDDVNLVGLALALSLQHQISLWDCLYLALAIDEGADLITADQRFYRSVSRHYPFVKLLGS